MKKIQTETQADDIAKVTAFVTKLNSYRHEYYNLTAPSVPSDAETGRAYRKILLRERAACGGVNQRRGGNRRDGHP